MDAIALGLAKKTMNEIQQGGTVDSKDIKVSSTDTTSNFLINKIVSKNNEIDINKINSGANEQLQIGINDMYANTFSYEKGDFTRTYTYDTVSNKIATITYTGDIVRTIAYTYIQISTSYKVETEKIIENGKQVLTTYTYDSNGNLLNDNTITSTVS